MIDLHTHTNYSDGTWNLRKILEEAEKTNIEVLSITDHNTINCYKELEKINIKDIFKGKIISIGHPLYSSYSRFPIFTLFFLQLSII